MKIIFSKSEKSIWKKLSKNYIILLFPKNHEKKIKIFSGVRKRLDKNWKSYSVTHTHTHTHTHTPHTHTSIHTNILKNSIFWLQMTQNTFLTCYLENFFFQSHKASFMRKQYNNILTPSINSGILYIILFRILHICWLSLHRNQKLKV